MICNNVEDAFKRIGEYFDSKFPTGYPLVVNVESRDYFMDLVRHAEQKYSDFVRYASDYYFDEFYAPDCFSVLDEISEQGSFFLAGLSMAGAFKGRESLRELFSSLLGRTLKGKAVVLSFRCEDVLKSLPLFNRDPRLERKLLFVNSGFKTDALPRIWFVGSMDDYVSSDSRPVSMKSFLAEMERSENLREEYIVCSPCDYLGCCDDPIYNMRRFGGVFDMFSKEFAVKYHVDGLNNDPPVQPEWWRKLAGLLEESGSLGGVAKKVFGQKDNLVALLRGTAKDRDDFKRWLYWVLLKNDIERDGGTYFSLCVKRSVSFDDLLKRICMDLLDFNAGSCDFEAFRKERRDILEDLAGVSAVRSSLENFAKNKAGKKGRNEVFYLTGLEGHDFNRLIACLGSYEYSERECSDFIPFISEMLGDYYLTQYRFPDSVTALDDDAQNKTLEKYFTDYRRSKLSGKVDGEFVGSVERLAREKFVLDIEKRDGLFRKKSKEGSIVFFVDSLGAEYMPFIEARCKRKGMTFHSRLASANLPTITSLNKGFLYPPDFEIVENLELDSLKHDGLKYRGCKEPLHLCEELDIIDKCLDEIKRRLECGDAKKVFLMSDHGASRLAVLADTYSTVEMSEKGEHCGRCCRAESDPNIPHALYENGYAVLANYDRFRGGRKATLETHGGASLEEVLVPMIELALPEKDRFGPYSLIDEKGDGLVMDEEGTYRFEIGKGMDKLELRLYSERKMTKPALEIEGRTYSGNVDPRDERHASFSIPLGEGLSRQSFKPVDAMMIEDGVETGKTIRLQLKRKQAGVLRKGSFFDH